MISHFKIYQMEDGTVADLEQGFVKRAGPPISFAGHLHYTITNVTCKIQGR